MPKATFRGLYEEHVVKVDAVTKRISIDDGPEVTFQGDEKDLRVTSADDSEVYLDVSALESDFQGQVKIGVKGRARRVLWNEILIQ